MIDTYRERLGTYEEELSACTKKSGGVGAAKLVLFFAFIAVCVQMWLTAFEAVWNVAAVAFFAAFCILCVIHERMLEKISDLKGLTEVIRKDICRFTGEWKGFSDTGEEYVDREHDYAVDLDIIGEQSLFQFMNKTNTCYGRKQLVDDLLFPDYTNEEIRQRQKAVEELRGEYEWTACLENDFSKIGIRDDLQETIAWLQDKKPFIRSQLVRILLGILCFLTCASVPCVFITKSNWSFSAFGILFLVQLAVGLLADYRIKKYLGARRGAAGYIAPYHLVIRAFAGRTFVSERMREIQARLLEAEEGMRQLVRISSHMKYTANPIAKFLLNVFLQWDYKNAFDFQKWKPRYADCVNNWFCLFGELESLMSFAGFARNCDTVCLPGISGEDGIFAEQLGHPLLENGQRVCNDFQMKDSIVIISGSNMSGKSTFMRTVGINLVLARAGSYVCAGRMKCPQTRIVTSMRIADRTTEGISTFYSELLKIRKIIEAAEHEKVFFLIDEIFRGTNSVDRLCGAQGVLRRLHDLKSTGILTTHDLEICRMADDAGILNYSFQETYRGEEMYFDYQIKKGISKTTNAEFLLRKLGIL